MNVIFDIDGVIRGTKPVAIKDALAPDLLALLPQELHNKTIRDYFHLYPNLKCLDDWDLGLLSKAEVESAIASVTKDPKIIVEALLSARLEKKNNYIYADTIEFVKKCKRAGNKVYILSNMAKETVELLRELFDMSIFDDAIFSCEIGLRKPDPEFYDYAISKWKIKPEDSVFIDDRNANLIPFEKLGGKVVLFNNKLLSASIKTIENQISF